jgi:hypothetical protein
MILLNVVVSMYQTHSEEVARLLLLQLLLQLLSNDVDVLSVACARIRKLRDLPHRRPK